MVSNTNEMVSNINEMVSNTNEMNKINEIDNKINEIDNNINEIINDTNNNSNVSNLLKIEKVFDINNLLDTLHDSLNNSAKQNNIIEKKLKLIDEKRENINKTFIHKTNKCKEYMTAFYDNNQKHKELFKLYTSTVTDILQKNVVYNNDIDNVLDQYIAKYTEYINNSHNISYPTNFLIQLVSNIILINDSKYKMNILFKNALKDEVINQQEEIKTIENINEKLQVTINILNECDEIYNIIKNIENDNKINIKEEIIKQLGDNI